MGRTKAAPINVLHSRFCLFYLVGRFSQLTRDGANSGLLRSNIPTLHFFFRIAKVLVSTLPIPSLGILDWIKFLSGRTSQLTHLSRMCLNRSVPIWNRQKYKEDNNGPATSQSVGQPVRVCCDCGRDIRGIFPFRLFCPLSYQRHLPRVRETFVLDYSTQKERVEMMWRMITFFF